MLPALCFLSIWNMYSSSWVSFPLGQHSCSLGLTMHCAWGQVESQAPQEVYVVTAQRKEHLNCFQGTIIFPFGSVKDFKAYVSLVSVCENLFSWYF